MLTPKEAGGASPPVYPVDINNSCLFGGSDALAGTLGAPLNQKRFTLAFWWKPVNTTANQYLWSAGISGTESFILYESDGQFRIKVQTDGTSATMYTVAKYLDATNHYHIVLAVDTTEGNAEDRLKLWVNGVRQTFTAAVTLSLNAQCTSIASGNSFDLAQYWTGTARAHCYLSDFYFIDGTALPASTFGELSDKVADLWVAKTAPAWTGMGPNVLAGGTWGSNPSTSSYGSDREADNLFNGDPAYAWYPNDASSVGYTVWYTPPTLKRLDFYSLMATTTAWTGFLDAWDIEGSDDTTNGEDGTWTVLDSHTATPINQRGVEMFFTPANPGTYKVYRLVIKGTTNGSDILNGLTEWCGYESVDTSYGTNGFHLDFHDNAGLGNDTSVNNNDFTVIGSPAQSDDTPTQNGGEAAWEFLSTPVVMDTAQFADVVVRPGVDAAVDINSLKFAPDWVNIKNRTIVSNWELNDTVRGAGKALITSATVAESNSATFTAFNGDGYSLGNFSRVNQAGNDYVDLALKTDPKAGFDIVTYTGDGSSPRNIAHNLGNAPTFIMIKRLDSAANWLVYHAALGATKYLVLNATNGAGAYSEFWKDTEPTSTHFTVGNAAECNLNGASYVAYLFTDSDVFKAFSYTGNGSTDGPAVDLGGRILSIPFMKNTVSGDHWINSDAIRDPHNMVEEVLYPNVTNAVLTGYPWLKVVANGFKVVRTETPWNHSGSLHVGLAILRQPFKYSNAF